MRGAVPCLSTDLTTRAVPHFIQVLQIGRRAEPKALNDSARKRQGLQLGDVRSSLRRAAAGEGARARGARSAVRSRGAEGAERFRAKRDEVCSSVTCGVLFSAWARRRCGFLGACRRRRRRGGLQLYQLRAAWGATGQLSGIRLGLWVSASGGAAQSASVFISKQTPTRSQTRTLDTLMDEFLGALR